MKFLGILILLFTFTASGQIESTKDFKKSEWMSKSVECSNETTHRMQPEVMAKVQKLRDFMGQPLTLLSAYRCSAHPVEARKVKPGQHTNGLAVDIKVTDGAMAFQLIKYALTELGATGFAYSKKYGFVHIDWRKGVSVTWNYST